MNTPPRIHVVEDDDLQYEIYEEALSKDYELVRVTSGSQVADGSHHSTNHAHQSPNGAVTARVTAAPMKNRGRLRTKRLRMPNTD